MDYHNIDIIIEICLNQFNNYNNFINDVNHHLETEWIILNIEYEREPRVSTIISYTLGHINSKNFNNVQISNIPQHDIALQLASIYIQDHKDKYQDEENFSLMCEDFCTKYFIAMLKIEDLNKKHIVNIK